MVSGKHEVVVKAPIAFNGSGAKFVTSFAFLQLTCNPKKNRSYGL